MPVTNEQLVATLSANIRKFEKAMDRASGKTNKTFTKIEKRGKTLQKRLNAISPNFSRFLGPAAIAGTLRAFQVFADSATRIENALKVAGLAGEDLERVYDRLESSAKKNFAPLESLANLYAQTALAQKELGITSEELLGFTDNVALALRVSGKTASESRGALIQLTQAMGAGVVRAEEFNAILEGALPIAQAAAAGLREAGSSVAKLRQLVIDGKISSEAFFRAFEAGAVILEDKVAGAAITTGQAYENLKTSLTTAARKMDDATGFTAALADGLQVLAGVADRVGDVMDRLTGKVGEFEHRSINYLQKSREQLKATLAEAEKLEASGVFTLNLGGPTRKDQIADLKNKIGELERSIGVAGYSGYADRSGKVASTTVSIEDFDAPTSKKKGKSSSEKFASDIARIQARTLAIQAETSAQAKLNPLIDDYEYAITKAAAVQDLLNEAKKAGLEITPQLRETIDGLAEGFANATVEANQLTESQDRLVDTAEDIKGLGKSVLGGFIDDLRNGVSAADAFKNALNRIADKLIDMAIQNLFTNALGGGTSIRSPSANAANASGKVGLFASGGYTGNAPTNAAAGVVHGQEFVVNAAATKKNRALLEAMNSGKLLSGASVAAASSGQRGGSGATVVPIQLSVKTTIDERGNIDAFVSAKTDQKIQEAAPNIVKASVDGAGAAIAGGKFKQAMALNGAKLKTKAR